MQQKIFLYTKCFVFILATFAQFGCVEESKKKQHDEFAIVNKHIVDSGFIELPFRVAKKTLKAGNGQKINNDDLIEANIFISFVDGTPITPIHATDRLTRLKVGIKQVLVGIDLCLATMEEGETSVFIVPPSLAYGSSQQGIIEPNTTLRYQVKIDRLFKAFTPKPYYCNEQLKISLGNGIEMCWQTIGTGTSILPKQTLRLHYSLYTENGSLVESSHTLGPPVVGEIGVGLHPEAWERALPKMRVGDKVRIFVPYTMAFGDSGKPPHIAPKTNVYYDLFPIQNDYIPF